jgi:hypothetical protein
MKRLHLVLRAVKLPCRRASLRCEAQLDQNLNLIFNLQLKLARRMTTQDSSIAWNSWTGDCCQPTKTSSTEDACSSTLTARERRMLATEITDLQRLSSQTCDVNLAGDDNLAGDWNYGQNFGGPRFKAAETVKKWKAGNKSSSGANTQHDTGSQGMFTPASGARTALPSLRRNESDPLQDEIKQATPGTQCLRDVAQSEEMHGVKAPNQALRQRVTSFTSLVQRAAWSPTDVAVPPPQSQSEVDFGTVPPPQTLSPEQSTPSLRGLQKPGRPDLVDGDQNKFDNEIPSLLTPPLDAASREPTGRMATVGLMLWPGPEDELMVTDKKAGTSAATSALIPGDGRQLDPGAPVLCLSVASC